MCDGLNEDLNRCCICKLMILYDSLYLWAAELKANLHEFGKEGEMLPLVWMWAIWFTIDKKKKKISEVYDFFWCCGSLYCSFCSSDLHYIEKNVIILLFFCILFSFGWRIEKKNLSFTISLFLHEITILL